MEYMEKYSVFIISITIFTILAFYITKMFFKKKLVIIKVFVYIIPYSILMVLFGALFNNSSISNLLWEIPLFITLILIFLLILYKLILSPLKELKSKLGDAKNFNLIDTINKKYSNEFSEISENYNNYLSTLNSAIKEIKKTKENSVLTNIELTASFGEVSLSIEEIQNNISNIFTMMNTLDTEIQKCNTLSEDMRITINDSVDKITNQAVEITESSSVIEVMISLIKTIENTLIEKLKIVDDLVVIAKDSAVKINNNNEIMKKVVASTRNILNFIDIINDISEMTNLLAMNAAIQASHAGEQGKGFLIIATEIRKLAESTSLNSKSVHTSLKNILDNIHDSEKSTTEINEVFQKISITVSDISDSMIDIKTSMNNLTSHSKEIILSLSKQMASFEKLKDQSHDVDSKSDNITLSMSNISLISSDTKNKFEEINTGFIQILNSIEILSQSNQKNSDNLELLDKLVSKFKTEENNYEQ